MMRMIPNLPGRPVQVYLVTSVVIIFLIILTTVPQSSVSHDRVSSYLWNSSQGTSSSKKSSSLSFLTSSSPLFSSSSSSSSSSLHNQDPLLEYRRHLELTTSSSKQRIHSPTLTFSKIYVLSLPSRTDRRESMDKLARALGLEIEFVDAYSKEEPFIKWIAERVVEVRKVRKAFMAKALETSPNKIGGLQIGNDWLKPTADYPSDQHPFPPFQKSKLGSFRSPSTSSASSSLNWVEDLEAHFSKNQLHLLQPKNSALNVTKALWDSVERINGRQVNEGVISTFFGHTRAMMKILENDDDSALILEDDVDLEWDLERLWTKIESKLPKKEHQQWEIAFLGHCWGKELLRGQYRHPMLHRSVSPLCLHAYALTSLGARRMLTHLNNPWTAYSTAVDTAVPSLIQFGLLNQSFSIDPPIVIQRKDGKSDIQEGVGSIWRGVLMDSTWERIQLDEARKLRNNAPITTSTSTSKSTTSWKWRKYRKGHNVKDHDHEEEIEDEEDHVDDDDDDIEDVDGGPDAWVEGAYMSSDPGVKFRYGKTCRLVNNP